MTCSNRSKPMRFGCHGPDIWEFTLKRAPVFLGAVLIVAGRSAPAATISWTNLSGGDWSAAANWDLNQVPGPSDSVVIAANGTYTVRLDVSATIASLALG